MSSHPMLKVAQLYRDAGLSVIGCNRKRACTEWTPFKTRVPTDDELSNMFINWQAPQIAVICGIVSGGLEVIDVDTKNDHTGQLWDNLMNDLLDYFNSEPPLLICQTASGGVHIYYRCEEIGGNQKLASHKEAGKLLTIIETRGEGGYVIAPPSENYKVLSGTNLATGITTITPEVRTDLLDICRKYNQVFKEDTKKPSGVSVSVYRETPWDAYNLDESDPWRDVLTSHGWSMTSENNIREYWQRPGSDNKWSATWHKEKRLLYIFTTSSVFESEKAYSPFAVYAYLNCAGSFSEATKELRAAGYGTPFIDREEKVISKSADLSEKGLTFIDIFNMCMGEYVQEMAPELKDLGKEEREKKINDDLTAIVNTGIQRAASRTGVFWTVNKRGKIELSYIDLAEFLTSQGFYLFIEHSKALVYRIVKVVKEEHLVYEVSSYMIKQYLKEWINDNIHEFDIGRKALLNALITGSPINSAIEWMGTLSMTDVTFLRDTRTESYLPFKNGIVHINAKDIDLIQYSDLPENTCLWANQIKDRDIDLITIQKESEFNQNPIYRFFKRLSGITPELEEIPAEELARTHPEKVGRLRSILTVMGYCMTNYKDPAKPYMIWIGEDTDDSDKGGGAGKTLLFKIVGQVRVVVIVPGKTWDPTSTFAYQLVKLGTDMFIIEDLPDRYKIENLYNVITEGMMLEKKNQDSLTITYEYSPKIGGTSNYTPDKVAEHARRRIRELIITKYFTDDNPPDKELGGLFFSDSWTNTDWQMFFNLCFYCIRTYLRGGIYQEKTTENVRAKEVKIRYRKEFYKWITEWMAENKGKWVGKTDMYEDFLESESLKDKEYSGTRFHNACEFYAKTFDLTFKAARNKKRENGTRDKTFCIFVEQGTQVPDLPVNGNMF